MSKILSLGTKAPSFNLKATPDQSISLDEYLGSHLIILFYPADWSPVCTDEILIFNELTPEFRKHQTEIVGISVDSYWCHNAFAGHRHIHFPLLSDFEPKGEVAKKYGVYRDKEGVCERAIYLVDKTGMIAYGFLSPVGRNLGAEGILEALERLTLQDSNLSK